VNFEFSEELQALRAQAKSFLRKNGAKSARNALENQSGFDRALWESIADQGWIGAAIPEKFGGSEMGEEALCVLADEIGASLAAIPFASNAYIAAPALLHYGSEAQKTRYLPLIASGEAIFCLAHIENAGPPSAQSLGCYVSAGKLHGHKIPVIDGTIATHALVSASAENGEIGLYIVALEAVEVVRESLISVDPSRDLAKLSFEGAAAETLELAHGISAVTDILDRAAIPMAFEQIGGAQSALEMARDYALTRQAFGRSIASFQAIKHKLAEVYVLIELARSNAYYGAYALASNAPDLTQAAAASRIAAIKAFEKASQENIQTHGGMGFTWEFDCHLYYRRAKHLSLALGAAGYWKDRLISALESKNAA